jgi:hypothetical protein
MDVAHGLLRNAVMTWMITLLFLMYPISLRFWGVEKLVRAFSETIGSTSGGSESGVGSSTLGIFSVGGTLVSLSKTSSDIFIKIFYSLHLCPGKYFLSQL